MTMEQAIVFGVLVLALVLFVVGRWRYDIVALLALLIVAFAGIVPRDQAFAGFGHPAVVTVAAVLVASRGLLNSGLVDGIAKWLSKVGDRLTIQVTSLTGLVTVCSAFMNNVGALALLMPAAVQIARKNGHSPSLFLLPLAFGSLLGGMMTLIGTPPNIIIAAFREETGAQPFRMFDFTPVGAAVAAAGILFISLVGWHFIPRRKGQASREELFHVKDYLTEVRVPQESRIAGKSLREIEAAIEDEVTIVGLVRGDRRIPAPPRFEILRADDILVVEADSQALKALLDATGLELVGSKELSEEVLGSDEVGVMEAVVMPDSPLEGNTAWTLNLRWRYGVNILGVARQGSRLEGRLRSIQFMAGDVLLLQGETESLRQALALLGCLPLAERGLRIGQRRRLFLALGIFAAGLAVATMGLLPIQIAFVGVAVAMVLAGLLSLREAYEGIEWPVIVLLGAMIPVGQALESTGGAALIASGLLQFAEQVTPAAVLATLVIGTMLLSNVVNNAAAAVLMAPVGISLAQGLGASADPFLMGVAIGSSAPFLTPIGHQSNTLVMGPGGYKFGDYWRVGFPLSVIVVGVAVPLILIVWPLGMEVP